ncbi:hypothetical protein BGZ90_005074 [Linnemannia elongata]|nr:hypothetical protein BGZ90_005074 [Linnemannia elongata]
MLTVPKKLWHAQSEKKYHIVYNNSGFDNFMLTQEAIYSNLAIKKVMVDGELFFKVKDVVADISSLNLEDELTTASMTYKAFLESLDEETRKNIPIVDLKMNKIIRQAVIGGRTQVFQRGIIMGKIRCIDVTSLYLFVMTKRGYYWECSSYDIFKPYMGSLMEKKMEQDVLKESGSEEYNPALREMLKLWMNALSGKAI